VIAGDPDAPRNPRLGVVYLNLAQYVDAGVITRRYLLRESKTNATLKVSSHSSLSCPSLTRRHSSPSTSNTLQANSPTWPLRSPKARSSRGSLASSNRPTFTAPVRAPRTSTRTPLLIPRPTTTRTQPRALRLPPSSQAPVCPMAPVRPTGTATDTRRSRNRDGRSRWPSCRRSTIRGGRRN
jgi:hypothetical protein